MTAKIITIRELDPEYVSVREAVEFLAEACSDQDPIECPGLEGLDISCPDDLIYELGERRLAKDLSVKFYGGPELGMAEGTLLDMVIDRQALQLERMALELRKKRTKRTRRK